MPVVSFAVDANVICSHLQGGKLELHVWTATKTSDSVIKRPQVMPTDILPRLAQLYQSPKIKLKLIVRCKMLLPRNPLLHHMFSHLRHHIPNHILNYILDDVFQANLYATSSRVSSVMLYPVSWVVTEFTPSCSSWILVVDGCTTSPGFTVR